MFLIHVKFCANWMLLTIQSIKLILYIEFLNHKNLKHKHLIDDIAINF